MDVVFRKYMGEVVAVFPTIAWDRNELQCYARIGQHSGCRRDWYVQTKPATPEEFRPLYYELRRVGYMDITVKKRIPSARWRGNQ